VLGNCGLTNQADGPRSAAMTCWVESFGWDEARAREKKI